ncbi:DUF427 domain-containing protein [Phenylobacterium sp.]|uniref:DUF427 domain-containing protein n=1 Tax=Phenylobacterium sp. TaxID=1871053 RepID=UPI0025FCB8CD|nr:DUF427 domain-containing protein [Phenylobacterium sp.]
MKIPGPDHPITVTPATKRWRARFQGHVIADSADALVLQEASYPPVVYFPRDDVSMEYMSRTAHSTHCPYKGDASYYTLLMDGHFAENAVWTYETPFPAMQAIENRLAFYPNHVEVYEVEDAAVNPHHVDAPAEPRAIDQVVQHTDAGDGTTQREHWPPNTTEPPLEGGVR